MSYIIEMGTLTRHNNLSSSFLPNIWDLFRNKEVFALQENCMLCFNGRRYSGLEELIDLDKIEDLTTFKLEIINKLDFVQPDFFMYYKNRYIQNKSTSKTAGVPDLVVEVWSESNSFEERKFKKSLYGSSDKCEFWEIEQDSNYLKAHLGTKELWEKSIDSLIYSQNGLCFDLRHLYVG